jgi:hypothetical protein
MNSKRLIDGRNARRMARLASAFVALILLLSACAGSGDGPATQSPVAPESRGEPTAIAADQGDATAQLSEASDRAQPVLGPAGHYDTIQLSDDGVKHIVPLHQVIEGGPGKDGIPSIDNPSFVGAERWDEMGYDDDGLVIGVEVNGQRRAYPFQVLVWHEIVNDSIDGLPLLITYCPLCGTGIAFESRIDDDGFPVFFGVSGKLYNSDLLMYDRRTDSYWSQLTGMAVIGELTGTRLAFYPSEIMTWGDWRAAYPDSQVLNRDTGYFASFDVDMYDADPYPNYYESPSLWFPVAGRDDRLHNKARVTGVELDAVTFGAYPDEAVAEHGPVNDVVGETPLLAVADPAAGNNVLVFERELDGQVLHFSADGDWLFDDETGSRWAFSGAAVDGPLAGAQLRPVVTVKGFWFAWYAFHQDTELWLPEPDGS